MQRVPAKGTSSWQVRSLSSLQRNQHTLHFLRDLTDESHSETELLNVFFKTQLFIH